VISPIKSSVVNKAAVQLIIWRFKGIKQRLSHAFLQTLHWLIWICGPLSKHFGNASGDHQDDQRLACLIPTAKLPRRVIMRLANDAGLICLCSYLSPAGLLSPNLIVHLRISPFILYDHDSHRREFALPRTNLRLGNLSYAECSSKCTHPSYGLKLCYYTEWHDVRNYRDYSK
jgi:hypothetical protein